MASSGWQGNKEFPYAHDDMKVNIYIDSIDHVGDELHVTGKVAAVCPHSSSSYYAWYVYPVYVAPGYGTEYTLLSANERVYGGGNNGLDSSKQVSFDTWVSCGSVKTDIDFPVRIRMNNDTAIADVTWYLTIPASYTAPATPTISVSNIKWNKMDVTYGTSSFGNPSSGTVTLKVNGNQVASKTTTGNSTFTVTGLTKGTTYSIQATASNGQLSSSATTSATTKPTAFEKTYCSVNGQSKKVNRVYCSVNGQSKKVLKVYMSVDGKTKLAFEES